MNLLYLQVCLYGRNIFMGYLNEWEKTRETVDEEGWLHTGDTGKILEDSTVQIIGRIKVRSCISIHNKILGNEMEKQRRHDLRLLLLDEISSLATPITSVFVRNRDHF